MTDHRYEARADIVAGECELCVDGRRSQLVTLTLTTRARSPCPTAQTTNAPT
jgi:hypothetical protein